MSFLIDITKAQEAQTSEILQTSWLGRYGKSMMTGALAGYVILPRITAYSAWASAILGAAVGYSYTTIVSNPPSSKT